MQIASFAAVAAGVLSVTTSAGAVSVDVRVTGEVEFNGIGFGTLAGVNPGDAATLIFTLDSRNFVDSASFPTRGYVIDPDSFVLEMGSVTVGLQDPFPAGQMPFFVLRNDDPAVDGFFVSTNVDFPVGVPIDEEGGFEQFRNAFSVTYTGDTLGTLDLVDAAGSYDFTGLTVFNWTINDGPFKPLGLVFESLEIEPATPTTTTVLLVPDSGNDRVWAFSVADGTLVDDDFVPADGRMMQPINAVDSGHETIYVSDENADAVFEYAADGTYLRTVADAAAGLDALQGLAVRDDTLYVGSRTASTIYAISADGASVTPWATDGVATPRDILFRADDALASDSNSSDENIERLAFDGSFLETWHDSDGTTGIDFPQQVNAAAGGDVLVAGFSPPTGVYRYDADGVQIGTWDIGTSPRGVYELENGLILWAGGTRVGTLDPATGKVADIVNEGGTSFRYIEPFSFTPASCVADLDGSGDVGFTDLLAILAAWGPCPGCPQDLDGSGDVGFTDLLTVLAAWGPCP
ncbi:MAG: hypothetical protein HKN62_18270 [Phycisphaerales bacterium]|nr:hypothetical protein [Phycisphaerales bacterium]